MNEQMRNQHRNNQADEYILNIIECLRIDIHVQHIANHKHQPEIVGL